jgi:hypothetical protein
MLRVPRHRLPVSHATHLVLFVKLGHELGAPVEKMLEREHLPAKLAEESGCYVPTKAAWGFIERMAHKEGVRDLGFLVGYDGGLRMMGPTLAGQICRAATLAQALRRFCRFIRLESSEMKCWLTVEQEACAKVGATCGTLFLPMLTKAIGLQYTLAILAGLSGVAWFVTARLGVGLTTKKSQGGTQA